jgi:hypothetical protein
MDFGVVAAGTGLSWALFGAPLVVADCVMGEGGVGLEVS